ncbi:MAG: AsmA family protein [Gammaproteobacteria bacterium]|jgi:AsmA protein|nr:AsmA family protein [Gammaproteobacteria bacterium]
MKKLLKWLAWVFVGLIILLIIAGIAISKLINPNDYKPQIIAAVNKATGRSLSLPGNLSWTFFPNLGIHIGQASLSNPGSYGQATFAQVQSADVSIAVLPLLSGQIQANTLELEGLQLNLERKSLQDNNWTFPAASKSTGSSTNAAASSSSSSTEMAFVPVISNLLIKNANISFVDDTSGAHYKLNNVNFTGKHIRLNSPFWIQLSFIAQSNQPQMTANISMKAKLYANWLGQVYRLDTINADLDINMPRQGAQNLQVDTNLTGSALVDLSQDTLSASPHIIVNKQFNVTGNINVTQLLGNMNYTGQVQVSPFDLAEFMQSLGIKPPRFPNSKALSNVSLQGQFSGNKSSVSISKLSLSLNQSMLQGQFAINNFKAPNISTQLSVDKVDLSDYVDLKGAALPMQNISLQAQLSSRGWSKAVFPSTLNGQLTGNIQQITLKGLDLNEMFQSLNNIISNVGGGQSLQNQINSIQDQFTSKNKGRLIDANNGKQTLLGSLSLKANIQNGVLRTNQFTLNGPTIQAQGSGQVNLNKQDMNFLFYITSPVQKPSLTLPYRVSGPFDNLNQGVDWLIFQAELQKYLAQALQQGVQNAVKGSVNNLLNQLVNSINQ